MFINYNGFALIVNPHWDGGHLQLRDNRMNRRGRADKPAFEIFRIADHWKFSKPIAVDENEVLIGLKCLKSILKRCRPAFAEAASRRQA